MRRLLPVALAALLGGGAAAAPAEPIEEGRPFPALVLPSAEDGRPMTLSQFRGKKVILQVFASW